MDCELTPRSVALRVAEGEAAAALARRGGRPLRPRPVPICVQVQTADRRARVAGEGSSIGLLELLQ